MKRFAVFALLGPPIAAAAFYLLLLPLAGVLEGVPIVIDTPVLPVSARIVPLWVAAPLVMKIAMRRQLT